MMAPTLLQEIKQHQPPSPIAAPSSTKGCFCWQPTKASSLATVTQAGQHSKLQGSGSKEIRELDEPKPRWTEMAAGMEEMIQNLEIRTAQAACAGSCIGLSRHRVVGEGLGLRQEFLEACQEQAGCMRQIHVEKASWSGPSAEGFPFSLFAG